MGFAVVHMQKIGKGGLRGIQSHNQREKPSHTNQDIDYSKSKQNYDLVNSQAINYHKAIKDRIEHFATNTKTVRKDAVVMCNFIVTSDEKTMKAMTPEIQETFFQDSVKFFGDRYGHENIVNATVHMDETTPHLHLGIVPITNNSRLSAKTMFDRKELQSLQTDFAQEVGKQYGLQRGREGSERTHLSEERFKAVTARQINEKLQNDLKYLEEKEKGLQGQINTLEDDLKVKSIHILNLNEKLQNNLKHLGEKEKGLQGQINALEDDLKVKSTHILNLREIDEMKGKKSFLSDKVTLTNEQLGYLQETAKEGIKLKSENADLRYNNKRYKEQYETMEQSFDPVIKKNMELNIALRDQKKAVKDLQGQVKLLSGFIQEHGLVDRFKEWAIKVQAKVKAMSKSLGRER